MLAQTSYPSRNQSVQNPKAEAIGRELRLVANNLQKASEAEAKRDHDAIVRERSQAIQEARKILLDSLVHAAETLVGFINLKGGLTQEEVRAARIRLQVALFILGIHGIK